MSTLRQRFENAQRPAKVTVTVPISTLIRLEGIARQRGMSRREALEDAIRWWNVRQEQQLNRKHRIAVERAIRAAADRESVEAVLGRFRCSLQEVEREPLTSAATCSTVGDMSGGETEQLSFMVPVEMATELRELAAARERTLAAELRLALRAHLAREHAAA